MRLVSPATAIGFAPKRIAFGGGLVVVAPWLPARIEPLARARAMPGLLDGTDFRAAELGNDAGVVGAALSASHDL